MGSLACSIKTLQKIFLPIVFKFFQIVRPLINNFYEANITLPSKEDRGCTKKKN